MFVFHSLSEPGEVFRRKYIPKKHAGILPASSLESSPPSEMKRYTKVVSLCNVRDVCNGTLACQ